MEKEFEFYGIPSGDHETFCWDVTREVFIKIKQTLPRKYDESYFNKGLYRLYPEDLYKGKGKCKTIIKIIK